MLLIGGSAYSQNTFPTNGNVGIGTLTPQFPLDVNGSARVTGNLLVGGGIITASVVNTTGPINAGDVNVTNDLNISGNAVLAGSLSISSMVGVDNFEVLVNPSGQLFKGSKKVATQCVASAPAWFIGGNNVIPLINFPGAELTAGDIGTCDNTEFVLKANDIRRQWIHPGGSISFGTNIGTNTGGPEYRFNTGALRLQSMNSYGGPQIVFDGGQNVYGDWGIEYLATSVPGLNFWKPFASPNSNNYLFFIGDDGKVSVGAVTNSASARFNVDGWGGDGIKALCDQSTKAYSVFNKSGGNESFVIYGNGATHLGNNAQIGFSTIAIQEPTVTLNVNNQNNNGIKFHSTNPNVNIISINSDIQGISPFTVKASGKTYIGTVTVVGTHTDAILQVGGKVACKSLFVLKPTTWADKVFAADYKLDDLNQIEVFIKENERLPGIKSEKEILENGYDLNEMDAALLEKIENAYLYIIKQNKVLEKQNAELVNLQAEIKELKSAIKSSKN